MVKSGLNIQNVLCGATEISPYSLKNHQNSSPYRTIS
nr:MAG TPA: hypothetical protein [Caudoviricetes sp.]